MAAAAAIVFALSLGAGGCARRQTPVDRGDRDQVLYRGLGSDVTDLDPQIGTGTDEQAVAAALFEGLVREDPHDLHPIPGVADHWTVSPDGLRYVFHLRADARWSDGSPVTAADFVQSWRRMLSPALGAQNAGLLFILKGAEAFHREAHGNFAAVGAHALDARTVQVDLAHRAPYFLSLLCNMAWMPVPVRTVEAHGALDSRENPWAEPGTLVGDGPFILRSWSVGQVIVVQKSKTYWDAARVRLNGIRFYPIADVDASERAFRAGQLHLTDAVPPSRIAAYRAQDPRVLRLDSYLATYFYRINVRRPALTDPRVRRALALAVDRRGIVERILEGSQTAAPAFTPPGMGGYTPDPILRTDFAEARRLLSEAGHPGGRGLPPFTITFNSSELHRAIAEAIQDTWRRALGVRVTLRNEENTTMLADESIGDYDIVRASWVADYPDPTAFLDIWRSDSDNNRTGWANPRYDALLAQAANAPAPAERNALLRKAEDILLTDAPLIPIYYYTHVFLIQPSVHGWYPTLLDHHPYQAVWLGPPGP
ncbi:MAG: peptide ABC transporter substrate-binding protein [Opitutaceae bacterium]